MTFEHAIQTGIPSPVLVTPHHSQAKGKDLSLELLKFVAMILIINVHSYMMYPPKYEMFATGGTIGDALFEECNSETEGLARCYYDFSVYRVTLGPCWRVLKKKISALTRCYR